MKNITLCAFCLLCLGSMPLWATKGKDDNTADNPKPVAAAASSSASQARPKPTATPRKVVSRPEPFVLGASVLKVLQSTAPGHAKEKKALLENAAGAVELKISSPLTVPDDTTQLMAPFANVRSLSINNGHLEDLPLLPCPEKLESLVLEHNIMQAIQNITHYTNLHTLRIKDKRLSFTAQDPNQTERLSVLTQLHNLRTLDCGTLFTLDGSSPEESALLIRILDSNPGIADFTCTSGLADDVVQTLARFPLRRLSLMNSEIDSDKCALLPFDTLEELRLYGRHTVTNLEPLRDSALRVLHLQCQKNLGDTQVICSMPHLEELDLRYCRVTDTQAKPLLQLASRLRHLKLDGSLPRLSAKMHQMLKAAFGDKVSLEF